MLKLHTSVAYVFAAVMLTGCVPLILGAGATTGYFAVQERGLKQSAEDVALKVSLHERIGRLNSTYFKDISISTLKGDVLVTGVVANRSEINQIESQIAGTEGVRSIFNEIQLKPYDLKAYSRDKAIATNLRTRLTFTGDVITVNYDIHVVKGHVYIIGMAQDNTEMETILHKASTTKDVIKVHNYIRISDKPQMQKYEVQSPSEIDGYGIRDTY